MALAHTGSSQCRSCSNDFLCPCEPALRRCWLYPVDMPLREYQFRLVATALRDNSLACLPTGLGKTLVAAVVMLNYYRQADDAPRDHACSTHMHSLRADARCNHRHRTLSSTASGSTAFKPRLHTHGTISGLLLHFIAAIAFVWMCTYHTAACCRWFPGGKVVFLAPTNPLVAQQVEACTNRAGIPAVSRGYAVAQTRPACKQPALLVEGRTEPGGRQGSGLCEAHELKRMACEICRPT